MREAFSKCISLFHLPDVAKWNFSKLDDINSLFYGCFSLSLILKTFNININNKIKKENIFLDCINIPKIPIKFNEN